MAVKLTASADLLTLDTIHLQRSLREKRDESSPLGGDVSGCILPRDIISKLNVLYENDIHFLLSFRASLLY